MNNIVSVFFKLINLFYSYNTYKKITFVFEKLYSEWIKHSIGNCGDSVQISSDFKLEGGDRITIGDKTYFSKHCIVTAWDSYSLSTKKTIISIGSHCNFGEYLHLTGVYEINIGDYVLTGKNVTISDNNHGDTTIADLNLPPLKRIVNSKGCVTIGNNVWIGDKSTILSGVSIGDGAVIGANTVVTKNVPAYSVCVGNPGRIIKQN